NGYHWQSGNGIQFAEGSLVRVNDPVGEAEPSLLKLSNRPSSPGPEQPVYLHQGPWNTNESVGDTQECLNFPHILRVILPGCPRRETPPDRTADSDCHCNLLMGPGAIPAAPL